MTQSLEDGEARRGTAIRLLAVELPVIDWTGLFDEPLCLANRIGKFKVDSIVNRIKWSSVENRTYVTIRLS